MLAPTDLFVFGSRAAPRRPRINRELFPDAAGMVGPETGPLWHGPSAFADVAYAPLTGPYHKLAAGTPLPESIGVVADGVDIDPLSPFPETHHTFYPASRMAMSDFVELYMSLPWRYVGKK